MPLLDVSFMVEDPMLADRFDVRRRLSVMGSNGRVTATADTLLNDCVGVVTQQSPSELMRTEDGFEVPKRIFVASRTQLIAGAKDSGGPSGVGAQPDEVTWNGVVYTVTSSLPYSRYGRGFYEAVCEFRGPVPPAQ